MLPQAIKNIQLYIGLAVGYLKIPLFEGECCKSLVIHLCVWVFYRLLFCQEGGGGIIFLYLCGMIVAE